MRTAFDVAHVRRAEEAAMAALPGGQDPPPPGPLMQRAAAGAAHVALRILKDGGGAYGSRALLLVGAGNNGGDTLYAGVLLARRGVRVAAVPADPARVHTAGLDALRAAGGTVLEAGALLARGLPQTDLILDGLLGIGGRGGLRGPAAALAEAAHQTGAPILAVDLPSGVDADTGEVAGTAVRADVTVTFGALKPGLLIDPGAGRAGVIELIDIGLGPHLPDAPNLEALQEPDVAALLPAAGREMDKYRRGVVGLVTGSQRYPGAALLSVGAAVHAGVGAVRYLGPADVLALHPEVMLGDGRVQAWVAGCGLDRDETARRRWRAVLDQPDIPAVFDADALALLAESGPEALNGRSAPAVLTPHAGEAAALLGVQRAEVEARRLDAVRRLADTFGATALLKGATTLIAEPGAPTVRANTHATPALATAGSGDVLAGLLGGLLATGMSAFDAASLAAYLHGAAGLLAQRGGPVAASDLVAALPLAWHNLEQ
jgi:ADP-dependent NAD(P)H-hydrate dehydratase / NAD(P)H-hydrate epimerase